VKKILCSLVVGLSLFAITCTNEGKPMQASVSPENINSTCPTCEGDVSFAKNLSTTELAAVVRDNGIEVKEFSYQDGDIAGGYVLQNGENIESAIDNFKSKHISFLEEAGSSITANLAKESDLVASSGYQSLGKRMSTMLTKAKVGDISIVGMKVAPGSLEKAKGLNIVSNVSMAETTPTGLGKSATTLSSSHESWAPYYGKSKVTRQLTFQFFYFNKVSDFGSTSTYECETQIYDKKYADFDGYWSSNLPRGYHDTQFCDTSAVDVFAVGCAQASSLLVNTMYYAEMSLRQQTSPTAFVRIKGQKGHRFPTNCYSTWCAWPDFTTGSLTSFTAPINSYLEWWY
jgi:hypothetical protein